MSNPLESMYLDSDVLLALAGPMTGTRRKIFSIIHDHAANGQALVTSSLSWQEALQVFEAQGQSAEGFRFWQATDGLFASVFPVTEANLKQGSSLAAAVDISLSRAMHISIIEENRVYKVLSANEEYSRHSRALRIDYENAFLY